VVVLFLAGAPALVAALRHGIEVGDAAAVARSADALSGASANLGAIELARLCAVLAAGGSSGDLTGGSLLLQEIEAELGAASTALESRSA
jgi:two-component system sensor histidine kinase/response regulator